MEYIEPNKHNIELTNTDILELKAELGKIDRSEKLNELYILLCKKLSNL